MIFCFTATATADIYTLSLHDALPISSEIGSRDGVMDIRRHLLEGHVIPAHPLALTAERKLDERRQRALTRYYVASGVGDRKSTRLNSSHRCISYAVFCLKKKNADETA